MIESIRTQKRVQNRYGIDRYRIADMLNIKLESPKPEVTTPSVLSTYFQSTSSSVGNTTVASITLNNTTAVLPTDLNEINWLVDAETKTDKPEVEQTTQESEGSGSDQDEKLNNNFQVLDFVDSSNDNSQAEKLVDLDAIIVDEKVASTFDDIMY